MNQVMKNMTLDVLGKCIFGHEFNSVLDSKQKELIAYHDLIGSLLDMKSTLIIILFSKYLTKWIPFLSGLSDKIKIFNSLTEDLIEISKEKLKKGEDPEFMLDFMVKSTFEDDLMNQQELKSNIFAFFIAGHETTATTLSFTSSIISKTSKYSTKSQKRNFRNLEI